MNDFLNLEFKYKNLDNYIIRSSIFENLKNALPKFSGNLLDVGCGKMPYKDFVLKNSNVINYRGLDIETALTYDENIKADFFWDGIKMPFKTESFDCAMVTEVLEHCPEPEIVLKEIFRVLKPNGILFFTVPFLWNLHEVPHDEYRYTPYSLERHFTNCGFIDIKIKATGGWHASMAQMLGLWVKRSPMQSKMRKFIALFIKPIMKYLLIKDKKNNIEFREGLMITGLHGIVKKVVK